MLTGRFTQYIADAQLAVDTATEALMPGAFLVDLIPARESDLDSRLTITLIYNHPSQILASMGSLYDVSSSRGLRTYPN